MQTAFQTKKTYAETSSRANVNIMMRFRVIKLVGIFSLFVTAVFLYTFNKFVPSTSSYFTKLFQERSTKENHLSTRNQPQLIQANEQIIIFITSAPFYTSRRLSMRQTWLSLLVNNSVARGRSNIRTLMKTLQIHLLNWLSTTVLFADMTQKWR